MPTHAVRPCGADVLLQCLIRHGVDTVFAYPGGATLPIHQALTRVKDRLRTILPRHEQGGGFAAAAYARSSGKIGVCFATSGPGATNLVTCLADAHRAGVPLLAITGQVQARVLGTDAFQEIPIVSMCRVITKHHYLVTQARDIPRILREALHIATTGRPGPVLVDVPKDLQAAPVAANYEEPLQLPGYRPDPWPVAASPLAGGACEDSGPVHPVLRRLWQLVRDRHRLADTVLTSGVGPPQRWLARSWRFPDARCWISSDSQGAIGFALAAALGVQAAHPAKTVIAVDTPASFVSNVQELACAFCEKLPVKVLLLPAVDEGWNEPAVDFLALARGFRCNGRRINQSEELDEALRAMLGSSGPFVLDGSPVRWPLQEEPQAALSRPRLVG